MTDKNLLEAWCHWLELETLNEFSEDRKLMAASIRAVLAELEAAREVVEAAKHVDRVFSTSNLIDLSKALEKLDVKERVK